jgi:Ca2+-binding EF-hand superfamily protein
MARAAGYVLLIASATVLAVAIAPAFAASTLMSELDTDHDGTIDLNEVNAAAIAKFTQLDRNHDGMLSQSEYLALVDEMFKAADKDHDGTLDEEELQSVPGRLLHRLLKLKALPANR